MAAAMMGRSAGMRQSLASRLLDDTLARDHNTMTGLPFANTMGARSLVNAKPPQRSNLPPEPPSEFFFEYNFDENGVLFYLGTLGKRRLW